MKDIIETDHKSYVRDLNSKALLCNDRKALEQYKSEKYKKIKQNDEINNIKTEIKYLKEEFSEIKNLLIEILKKES